MTKTQVVAMSKYHMELTAIDYLAHPSTTWLRKYLSSHITVVSVISSSAPSCFPASYPPCPILSTPVKRAGKAFLHKGHVYGHGTLFAGLQPGKQGQFAPRSQNSA